MAILVPKKTCKQKVPLKVDLLLFDARHKKFQTYFPYINEILSILVGWNITSKNKHIIFLSQCPLKWRIFVWGFTKIMVESGCNIPWRKNTSKCVEQFLIFFLLHLLVKWIGPDGSMKQMNSRPMTLCKANMEFTLENWGLGDGLWTRALRFREGILGVHVTDIDRSSLPSLYFFRDFRVSQPLTWLLQWNRTAREAFGVKIRLVLVCYAIMSS